MLKEALQNDSTQKKLKMVEMMIRAVEQLNIKCEESGYNKYNPMLDVLTLIIRHL